MDQWIDRRANTLHPPHQLIINHPHIKRYPVQVLYGLLSDCVPINGKRRKPYFIIGWAVFVFCNLFICGLGRPSLNALISLVRGCVRLLLHYMCMCIRHHHRSIGITNAQNEPTPSTYTHIYKI